MIPEMLVFLGKCKRNQGDLPHETCRSFTEKKGVGFRRGILLFSLLLGLGLFTPNTFAQSFCSQVFKDRFFLEGEIISLKAQTSQGFQYDIHKAVESRQWPEAARLAGDKGLFDLQFFINRVLRKTLERAPLKEGYPKGLRDSDGAEVFLVEFDSGVRAIFKPDYRHEQGVQKAGEGAPLINPGAEVAASKLSRLFGLNLVPMTLRRSLNGVAGTLQVFVEGARLDEASVPTGQEGLMRSLADLSVFDYIIHNGKRGQDTRVVNTSGVWAIENGSFFHFNQRPGSQPAARDLNLSQVSLAFHGNLKATTPGLIRKVLQGELSPSAIDELIARQQQVLALLREQPVSVR